MTDFQKYLNGTKLTRLEQVSAMALQGLIARDGARGTNTPKEYLAEEAVKVWRSRYSTRHITKFTYKSTLRTKIEA